MGSSPEPPEIAATLATRWLWPCRTQSQGSSHARLNFSPLNCDIIICVVLSHKFEVICSSSKCTFSILSNYQQLLIFQGLNSNDISSINTSMKVSVRKITSSSVDTIEFLPLQWQSFIRLLWCIELFVFISLLLNHSPWNLSMLLFISIHPLVDT